MQNLEMEIHNVLFLISGILFMIGIPMCIYFSYQYLLSDGKNDINMKCKNCEYWSRETITNTESTIGQCSKLGYNGVNYWDSNDIVNEKTKVDGIGCENLYTGEDFGCIHFVNHVSS